MPTSTPTLDIAQVAAWLGSLVLGQRERPLRLRIGGSGAALADALLVHSFSAEERRPPEGFGAQAGQGLSGGPHPHQGPVMCSAGAEITRPCATLVSVRRPATRRGSRDAAPATGRRAGTPGKPSACAQGEA